MNPQTPSISTLNEITLITLQNCPSDIAYISGLFEKIASMSINIDMISLAPSQGAVTALSFTISDNDLGKILEFTSKLRENSEIRTVVSSGNSKISVYDLRMKNTPGMASKVFRAAASVNTDIRIITTSEVEISMLVTAADYDSTLNALKEVIL